MSKVELTTRLIDTIIKASSRGNGRTVSPQEAQVILEDLAADDNSPAWDRCREPGRTTLRTVIGIYRRM